jgi:hypothetical protein
MKLQQKAIEMCQQSLDEQSLTIDENEKVSLPTTTPSTTPTTKLYQTKKHRRSRSTSRSRQQHPLSNKENNNIDCEKTENNQDTKQKQIITRNRSVSVSFFILLLFSNKILQKSNKYTV